MPSSSHEPTTFEVLPTFSLLNVLNGWNCWNVWNAKDTLESAVLFQLPHHAIIDQVFGLEAADFFVRDAQQTNNVANAFNAGIEFFLIESNHALITFFGVLDTRQPHSFGEDLYDIAFILRIADEGHCIDQSSEHIFDSRRQ